MDVCIMKNKKEMYVTTKQLQALYKRKRMDLAKCIEEYLSETGDMNA